MKYVEAILPTPAENLACDEALLDDAEVTGEAFLRIWESPQVFVVVGYGNDIDVEVDTASCARRGVPVLRRCSGGGTVVQGPGCLSYALCLQVDSDTALSTVTGTNRYVMDRIAAAVGRALGADVSVQGHTDLAIRAGDRWLKFSGNAQRRRRNAVLFHGTILYAFHLPLIAELLRFPSRQPDYRSSRDHLQFVTNVSATRDEITATIKNAWQATEPQRELPLPAIQKLVSDRYGSESWIRRQS